ncbi:MAG: hypothetical protein NTU47_01190 [Ignavibacteriales bacterium]|nr:hypothetical protein [Ignavibacteriales bacterium]
MKSRFMCITCLICCLSSLLPAQSVERFSSNPIPKLNVLGIAQSEDLATANNVLKEVFKEKMKIELLFPVIADPTYKKLKEQSMFDIALNGKSTTGKKFFTCADSLLELNANPFSMLLVDRKGTIRAINQAMMIDPRLFSKVVEEVLLNLDGKEAITVDKSSPWQTDLGRDNEAKKPKALISFGSSEDKFYTLLGKQVPAIPLKALDGTNYAIADSLKGRVTLIFVFVASSEPDAQMNIAGAAITTQLMNAFYKALTLGEAPPGDEFVKNAVTEGAKVQ